MEENVLRTRRKAFREIPKVVGVLLGGGLFVQNWKGYVNFFLACAIYLCIRRIMCNNV